MAKFKVRDHLNSHDDDDAWVEVVAYDAEGAAEAYLESTFPYEESQGPFEVQVMDANGAVSKWVVDVEFEPTFSASPLKEVIINGRKKSMSRCNFSYSDAVYWALPGADPANHLYTVTFWHSSIEGTLIRGQITELLDGMVINVADTSQA